ncbi:MAG: hypothetical protein KIC54_03415 [Clostridium sp.]|jgi:hypothetical protein|nr:hypothetical protein [Clostridium sp.]
MELKNRLKQEEIDLLNKVGIKIKDGKYTIDETGDIIERLDSVIQENLNENGDMTEKAIEYESIQDKILEFEKEI